MFAHRDRQGSVSLAFTDRNDGVSTGTLGPLNLGRTDVDAVSAVRENFRRVRAALGLSRIVTLAQQHTAEVVTVTGDQLRGWGPDSPLGSSAGRPALQVADALVSDLPDVGLCIRTADCLPVLFADAGAGIVGAAHAGRVGLAAGVLENTVAAMTAIGARSLSAWIGPHICGACYEVPAAMRDEVAAVVPAVAATTSWQTPALDLGRGAATLLTTLGCRVRQVGGCTRTTPGLHSHRRDGAGAGRLAGIIWRAG